MARHKTTGPQPKRRGNRAIGPKQIFKIIVKSPIVFLVVRYDNKL